MTGPRRKIDIAADVYGTPLPNWIEALANACDTTSQSKTARRLSLSPSTISAVLAGTYQAGTGQVEQVVRGVLMAQTVACPVLGDIGTQECLKWRRQARDFRTGNAQDVTMFRACRRCPRHQETGLWPPPQNGSS